MKIAIIGCGGLGSYLCYAIMLSSLEHLITDIVLVDHDCLEHKNLPYLFIFDEYSQYIGKPKSFVLKSLITDINPKIKILDYYNKFPKFNIDCLKDYFIIDCRDTDGSLNSSDLKLNIDGNYAVIQFNPKTKKSKKSGRYTLGNSHINMLKFSILVLKYIFANPKIKSTKQYLIDLNNLYMNEELILNELNP